MRQFTNEQYYSTTELVELGQLGLFPVKTLVTIIKLINKGKLQAISIGTEKKKIYRIKGDELNRFLTEYEQKRSGLPKQVGDPATAGK